MNGDDSLLHRIGIKNRCINMVDKLPVGNQNTVTGAKVGPRGNNGAIFRHVTKKESFIVFVQHVIDEVVPHKNHCAGQLNTDHSRAGYFQWPSDHWHPGGCPDGCDRETDQQ